MIFYRYILQEHIPPFFFSLFVITFLFIMDLLVQMIDSILSKGLDPRVILEIFLLSLAWILALSIPMAVLVAALMAYGRLSADNEITAMKAAGIHLFRLILPTLIMAGLIAAGLVYFNNHILPEANHRASMLYMDISRKKPSAFIKEGYLIEDFKGYKIVIGSVDPKSGRMKDIKIYQEEPQAHLLTFAQSGYLEYINRGEIIRFTLLDGETHREEVKTPGNYFRGKFKKQVVYIDNVDDTFRRSKDKTRGDREMSSEMMMAEVRKYRAEKAREEQELLRTAAIPPKGVGHASEGREKACVKPFDYGRIRPLDYDKVLTEEDRRLRGIVRRKNMIMSQDQGIGKYMVEVHKKYSIPVACLVFVLIGAPLGIMARASGIAMGATYSIAFFLIYWVFLIGGESLADRLVIAPWLSMWAPNLIIGAFGIWLTVSEIREKTFLSLHWIGVCRDAFFRRFSPKRLTGR